MMLHKPALLKAILDESQIVYYTCEAIAENITK